MNQEYPSALLERAVKEFTKLPGIGRKTACRIASGSIHPCETGRTSCSLVGISYRRNYVSQCIDLVHDCDQQEGDQDCA